METSGTYYQLLELPPTCSDNDVKIQYKKLALKLHPDKNQSDPDATTRFQELQAAYEILGDVEKRKTYDENSDFIHRAFSGGNSDELFLNVPSKRVFWCLMAEAAFTDDAKNLLDFANNLESDVLHELLSAGVCGFTLLHMAAFAGKPKACKALIDLGAPINAKTQPLFIVSQQFVRPTPLDLTIYATPKKLREQTIKILLVNNAAGCGINLSTLAVGQQLVKHQFVLLRDEIFNFTRCVSTSVRRILRFEPRWREVISFPGEEAHQLELQRSRQNFAVLWMRFKWMILGGADENRWCVWGGNAFAIAAASFLFNFRIVDSLAILLVAMIYMLMLVVMRRIAVATVLSKDFNRDVALQRSLEWLQTFWEYVCEIRSWKKPRNEPDNTRGKGAKPKTRRSRRAR